MMKKLICLLLAFMLTAGNAFGISAEAYILYDPVLGLVLEGKNTEKQMRIASTTKIMTALTALEFYDTDRVVKILPQYCGAEGSSVYLKPGEELTVRDLLYGLLLESGNDAAVALSYLLSGDMRDFVAAMNEKARDIGLAQTSFANPHGLDEDGHYSTAFDMAVLTAEAINNRAFIEICSAEKYTCGTRYMKNHNKLLTMYPGCIGIKTGFTKEAGRCLVSAAEKNGRKLICVTLNAPDDWNDHITLYESIFSQTEERILLSENAAFDAYIAGVGETELYVNESFSYGLTDDEAERVRTEIIGPRITYAPVMPGERYGSLRLILDGEIIFETDLYFRNSLEDPHKPGFFEKILDVLRGIK